MLPSWVVCVIVLFVTEGDFLLPLPAERFLVCVMVCGGGVPYGIRILTALQRADKPDQIVCKTTIPTIVPSKIRASQKQKTETATREYSRIYNRLKARKRRGRITTDEWNRQVVQAQELKDAFLAKQITQQEYVRKLEEL